MWLSHANILTFTEDPGEFKLFLDETEALNKKIQWRIRSSKRN
jgi:hypothetical protein